MKRLVDDFNRDWPDVTRTRETLVLAEEFGGGEASTPRHSDNLSSFSETYRFAVCPGMTSV